MNKQIVEDWEADRMHGIICEKIGQGYVVKQMILYDANIGGGTTEARIIAVFDAPEPEPQPDPEKHGYWITDRIGTYCSNCEYYTVSWAEKQNKKKETLGITLRCPHCRAIMDGVESEEI